MIDEALIKSAIESMDNLADAIREQTKANARLAVKDTYISVRGDTKAYDGRVVRDGKTFSLGGK